MDFPFSADKYHNPLSSPDPPDENHWNYGLDSVALLVPSGAI